jgi:hypothetical protein
MTDVVVPITATFNVDTSANLYQVEQETVTPLAADFNVSYTDDASNNVFRIFSIAEGVSDASADIVVSVATANETIFKTALGAALKGAKDGGAITLTSLFRDAVKSDVETDLTTMGLFNILEAEALSDMDISEEQFGTNGANAMYTALTDPAPAQALLNLVATQLPYGQYEDISAGGNLHDAFISGDSLTFHFTITSTPVITVINEDVTGDASGGFVVGSAGVAPQSLGIATQRSRTANVKVIKSAAE